MTASTGFHEFTLSASGGQSLYACLWAGNAAVQPKAVVCLVHGLGEHCGRYAHVADAFNQAGFAVLSMDQRGHGRTAGPRGYAVSLDTMLDDVALLLAEAEKRYPGQPAFLYGHSMGGGLVLNYALRRYSPTKEGQGAGKLAGVIATSPALRTAFPPPAIKLALGRALAGLLPSLAMANELELAGLSRDPEVIEKYKSDPLVHDRISTRLAIDLIDSGGWALEHAAEFPLPLLLVHGSADRLTSAPASQEFAAKVPGGRCTLKIWEGFYHETHNEPEKEQVIGLMVNWIGAH